MIRLAPTTTVAKNRFDSGDHRVVSLNECGQKETTHPRQVKYVLYDNGATYQQRQLHAYHSNYRDEGIL